MDHVAILRRANIKKGDNLLGNIIDGTKTIESRWYVNKTAPWNKVQGGDTVYLKESGQPITAKATVAKTMQFEKLTNNIVEQIIDKYGKEIAPNTSKKDFKLWARNNSKKRYCILVFLTNVALIEPFKIDKTGYGISSAWLVTEDINRLRKN